MVFSYAGATRPRPRSSAAFARATAAGVILFARNIASRARLRATIARGCRRFPAPPACGRRLLVMIDQEGGFV